MTAAAVRGVDWPSVMLLIRDVKRMTDNGDGVVVVAGGSIRYSVSVLSSFLDRYKCHHKYVSVCPSVSSFCRCLKLITLDNLFQTFCCVPS